MNRNASMWAGVFFLVFSLIYFGVSLDYSYKSKLGGGIGPGFVPFWGSLFLVVSSFIYLFIAVRKEPIDISKILPDKQGIRDIAFLFLYLVIFAVIVPYAGFTIANSLMLFLMFRGYFKWYNNVIVSIGVSVFLYWAFVIWLMVPLPLNVYGW